MAGGNKKKKSKPAANPARGFATTSVASKVVVRVESTEDNEATPQKAAGPSSVPIDVKTTGSTQTTATVVANPAVDVSNKEELSPEEFERRLEESELQITVEKHAQKVKRDAQRQKSRLETDRRLLRGQAETINTRKWLPPELMDQILDLIKAESRFASSSLVADSTSPGRLLPEEDLTIKLWTLQETLGPAGFPEDKVKSVLQHVLDIAPNIGGPAKESIWGLEEALDWLARECPRDELPDYEQRSKTIFRPGETPQDSPLPSGATTPRLLDPNSGGHGSANLKNSASNSRTSREPSPRKIVVTCDSDIEPDDLIPVFLDTKAKLFQLQRPRQTTHRGKSAKGATNGRQPKDVEPLSPEDELKEAKLVAKIDRIDQDPLFDKPLAEHRWQSDRIVLEQEFAAENAAKKQKAEEDSAKELVESAAAADADDSEDEITREALKMAEEVLQQDSSDEDVALSDLFANLPMEETDPNTGRTANVINNTDGTKVYIRDFGKKWSGVSPVRALKEACRSR